jgi:hypothetical protein
MLYLRLLVHPALFKAILYREFAGIAAEETGRFRWFEKKGRDLGERDFSNLVQGFEGVHLHFLG